MLKTMRNKYVDQPPNSSRTSTSRSARRLHLIDRFHPHGGKVEGSILLASIARRSGIVIALRR